MKHSFILGGSVGFALTFVSSLLAGSNADDALRDASFGCLAVATLFRWLRGAIASHAAALLRERTQAAAAEAQPAV